MTGATGCGKPDLTFVIHHQTPGNVMRRAQRRLFERAWPSIRLW